MRIIRTLVTSTVLTLAGAGIVYAIYLSNMVTVVNSTVKTGTAALKLCDANGANSWTYGVNPSINIADIVPGQERDVFSSRTIYVGNDGHSLGTALGGGICTTYSGTSAASNSTIPLQLIPTLTYVSESCSAALTNDLQAKFDFNGTASEYKSFNEWSTNAESLGQVISPNQTTRAKLFVQLAASSTAQNLSCNFDVGITGKQV